MYRESLKQRLRNVEWLNGPLTDDEQGLGFEWMRNPSNFQGREAKHGPITRSSSIDAFWRALTRYMTERYNLLDGWPQIVGTPDREFPRLTPVEFAKRELRRAPFTNGSIIKTKGTIFGVVEKGRSIMIPGRTVSVRSIPKRPRATVRLTRTEFIIVD